MNWIHQAACRGHDPELWFSTRPSKTKTAPAQPKRPEFLEPRYALEKPAGIGDNRRES